MSLTSDFADATVPHHPGNRPMRVGSASDLPPETKCSVGRPLPSQNETPNRPLCQSAVLDLKRSWASGFQRSKEAKLLSVSRQEHQASGLLPALLAGFRSSRKPKTTYPVTSPPDLETSPHKKVLCRTDVLRINLKQPVSCHANPAPLLAARSASNNFSAQLVLCVYILLSVA